MAQMLDVEVMGLKRRMRNSRFVVRFDPLKEEGMVIYVLQTTIDMEEACDGLIVFVNDIRWSESESLGVPVIHLLIRAIWICHTVVTPAMNGSWAELKALEFALSWLFVLVIHDQCIQSWQFGLTLLLTMNEIDMVAYRVGEP